MPPALGRFSITTCWPVRSVNCCPTSRMVMSASPPGPKPMTMRMGRSGYDGCACAAAKIAPPSRSTNHHPPRFVMATFIRGMTRGPMPMPSRRLAAQTSNQSAESRASAPCRAPANLTRSATRFRTIIARARSTSQREEAMNAKSQRKRSRREFLAGAGACALAAASAGPARAAMGPDDKFDLVIKGAEVLDPSQSLRGRRDIGIRYGLIEALEADIPAARALRVLDAAGKLATPGLIDLHCHVYPYGSAIGIPADELVAHQCTTTCVSAGDAGANNFA